MAVLEAAAHPTLPIAGDIREQPARPAGEAAEIERDLQLLPRISAALPLRLRRALMQVEQLAEADEGILGRGMVDQAARAAALNRLRHLARTHRRVAPGEQIALARAESGAATPLGEQGEVPPVAEAEQLGERGGGLRRDPRYQVIGRLPVREERVCGHRARIGRALAEPLKDHLDPSGTAPRLPRLGEDRGGADDPAGRGVAEKDGIAGARGGGGGAIRRRRQMVSQRQGLLQPHERLVTLFIADHQP